jgi:hypothetical protein
LVGGAEEVLARAALSRREKALVMGFQVFVVAGGQWGAVASSVGFTSSGSGLRHGFAGTESVTIPDSLQVVGVTRRKGGLVALLVQATMVSVDGSGRWGAVANAFAVHRRSVAGEVVGVETIITSISIGTRLVLASHFRGADAELLVLGALVFLPVGRAENVDAFARFSRRVHARVLGLKVVRVAGWPPLVTTLLRTSSVRLMVSGLASAEIVAPNALKVIVVTRCQGGVVALLVDVAAGVAWESRIPRGPAGAFSFG